MVVCARQTLFDEEPFAELSGKNQKFARSNYLMVNKGILPLQWRIKWKGKWKWTMNGEPNGKEHGK